MYQRKKDSDASAGWLAALVIVVVLVSECAGGCSETERPVELTPTEDAGAPDAGEPDAGAPDAGLPDAGEEIETVLVSHSQTPSYRNLRLLEQCRREGRRNAEEATTKENKDEARERARALAVAGEFDLVLVLARVAYGETGVPRATNDDPSTPVWEELWAFLAVIDGRRGSMSRVEMLVNYSPRRIFPHPEDVRQRWIAELQLDGTRPPSWPAWRGARWHHYPPWRSYGCPRWLATVEAVERTLRLLPDRVEKGPCEEKPDHWGGARGVDDRALELGWRQVDCGPTRNRFWVVPEEE